MGKLDITIYTKFNLTFRLTLNVPKFVIMPRHPSKTILIINIYVLPIGIEPITSDYKTDILPFKLREKLNKIHL
jgi:hypothetical protein